MLEVEAVPQSCIPEVQIDSSIVLYMRSLLLVESFVLVTRNKCSNPQNYVHFSVLL
jgi:hypothetical protein